MNTNITQVVSKVLIIGLISIVFIGCTLKNKHQPKQTEIMSQLEVRSIQTKSFTSDNELFVYYPKKNKQHFLNCYSKRAKITVEMRG